MYNIYQAKFLLYILSTITFLFKTTVGLDSNGNCLGLVLKGGANRGSYEAGVI